MRNTNNKKEYRRLLAILQKAEGRTFEDIAKEHGVSSRSVQRWVAAYIQGGIDRVKIKKTGGSKSGITDKDRDYANQHYLMILIYLVISEILGV
ncbi:MAG: helix-turn-helix domain-containing protein [Nitrososphaeraceae archaeon]